MEGKRRDGQKKIWKLGEKFQKRKGWPGLRLAGLGKKRVKGGKKKNQPKGGKIGTGKRKREISPTFMEVLQGHILVKGGQGGEKKKK